MTNDLAVVDPTISRKHADLKATPGGVEVTDNGSSNGTFVNGVQIEHSLVVPGDEVTFGKVVFRLEKVAPVRPPDPSLAVLTALHMIALQNGASVLRVHDVRPAMDAIAVHNQLVASRVN